MTGTKIIEYDSGLICLEHGIKPPVMIKQNGRTYCIKCARKSRRRSYRLQNCEHCSTCPICHKPFSKTDKNGNSIDSTIYRNQNIR